MEIERKFLVKEIPNDLSKYKCLDIVQAYISTDPVIRLRKNNDAEFMLTLKSKGHLIREEIEFPLTKEQYLNLWPKVESDVISKKRYLIPIDDDLVAELDIYEDFLEGLVTVEVEFETQLASERFTAPSWFGRDLTHDSRYKNSSLAIYGLSTLKK
jgi:CYTH domain-containing protein